MLETSISQIKDTAELTNTIKDQELLMVCCGRNGPMCLPVYDVMEAVEGQYKDIAFRVVEFDGPAGPAIRALPETRGFMGLPFTLYFRDGKVVVATSSIQSKAQVTAVLNEHLSR